jgi:hypothetical protein
VLESIHQALAYLPLAVVWNSLSRNLLHAALSVCNVILLAYAVRTFIGWRATREDASSLLAPLAAAGVPLGVPAPEHLEFRPPEVLAAVYLMFNEDYLCRDLVTSG